MIKTAMLAAFVCAATTIICKIIEDVWSYKR